MYMPPHAKGLWLMHHVIMSSDLGHWKCYKNEMNTPAGHLSNLTCQSAIHTHTRILDALA